MVSEANEPGSESGKRSDDRRGAARGTRAGSWSPQEGGASRQSAARLSPRSPGSFAAAAMVTPTASLLARGRLDGWAGLLDQPILGEANLRHRVAVAQRDRAVLHGVVVDGDAEGRPDLILAAVAPTDRGGLVVVGRGVAAERIVDAPRALRLAVLAEEGKHRRRVGGEAGMEAEHHARLALDLVLVVGVHQEGERRAVGARRRLDDVGEVALAPLLVEVGEVLAAVLAVPLQVEVGAVRDPLELGPAEGEGVLDVDARLGVVGELVAGVRAEAEAVALQAEADVPLEARVAPVVIPPLVLAGADEELELHLLELARAEEEVARGDLVAERAPDRGDAEGELQARGLEHVAEVDEGALRGFRAQERHVRGVLERPDEGLEHEVELARLGELAAALGTARARDLVGAKALLAALAVDERVREAGQVAGGLPHPRVHDDRRVEADDVVATGDDLSPPGLLHVALELDAERAVVEARAETAVDLAARVDEPPPLAEVHHLLHRWGGHW